MKKKQIRMLDMFCGGGGSSRGAAMAGATPTAALDMWKLAADTYKLNFPESTVYRMKASSLTPVRILNEVGRIDLLLASPECTSHSVAKGNKPRCERSRETAFEVIRLAKVLRPRQHSRAPEVIKLARALGRSPGSVAMKLNNFTSLDPKETTRGVRGLSGASKLDKQVWEEFHADWEKLAEESEELWLRKVGYQIGEAPSDQSIDIQPEKHTIVGKITVPLAKPSGPMEGERMVRVRYAQNFFRRTVLIAYNIRCCISGIPIPNLLIASHILPWSKFPEYRVDPRNGLCLSRLHDAAFD